MLSTEKKSINRELRRTTNRLLGQRATLALSVAIVATVLAAIADWQHHTSVIAPLYSIMGLQVVIVVGLWGLLRSRMRRQLPVLGVVLAAALAMCSLTGLAGIVRQDPSETVLYLIVISLGVAMLLPWGVRGQLPTVVVAVVASSAVVAFVHGDLAAVLSQETAPVLIAFAISVYGARVQERYGERIEQRNLQLRWRSTALESAANGIVITDPDGIILWTNPAFTQLTGYAADEAVGRNPRFLKSDRQDREFYRKMWETIRSGEAWRGELVNRRKDGRFYSEEMTITPVRADDGQIINFVAIKQDIEQRKRAEEALRASEERYRELFENATDIVYTHDLTGIFTSMNNAAERVTGYTKEDIGKTSIAELIAPEHLEMAVQATLRELDGEILQPYEIDILTKAGRRLTVEVHTRLICEHGEPVGVQGIARDVCERKQAEDELKRAKEAAEAGNRAKSEFLANMSHEIRTPMNGILGMTELALNTELTPEQREYVEMVQTSAESLMTVINDVLDFSKIEAGKLALDAVDFDTRDHLGDTMRILALRAHSKELELTYELQDDVPAVVVGDPHRLRQVLVNLVGNAIKFTDQGEVAVSVDGTKVRGGGANGDGGVELHFAVRDTGIGIAPDKQQAIFDAFTQADATTTRRYGGTGLGLTISRRLIEMMGGRLWLESEPAKGSTFHFTARCRVSPQQIARPQPAPLQRLHDLPVLVVDDNATNRRILNEMLTQWQMRPATVDGGAAALGCMMRAVANKNPFPLVLIDAHMPEMDGFELVERIRQNPALSGATIMMLSSADLAGEVARCRKLGVTTYLTKPIRQSELLDAILTAFGSIAPAKQGAAVVPSQSPVRRLHVLLAEDNAVNQHLAVRMLEKRGCRVTVANDGREALAAYGRERFDVVLMDVQMPHMDGFEATAAIRQLEKQSGTYVPIVALTAHAMSGDEERCLAAGMDAYVSKPMDADRLLKVIAAVAAAPRACRDRAGAHAVSWRRMVAESK